MSGLEGGSAISRPIPTAAAMSHGESLLMRLKQEAQAKLQLQRSVKVRIG